MLENKTDILLNHIIKYSFDEIFVTDDKGVIKFVSERFVNLFGIQKDEVINKNVYKLEKAGIFAPSSITGKVLKSKKIETIMQQTPMGRKIVVSGYPMMEDNKLIGAVCFSRDITELDYLKQTNEQVAETVRQYKKEIQAMKNQQSLPQEVQNTKMNKVFDIVEKVAGLDVIVLLEGETGVGKNYIARKIHEKSHRKQEPFIEVNCGAIPETLIESELFGYEEGAFTGAKKGGKKGFFEAAGKGTIFLDEISELPLNLQVKLLSVLQNFAIQRVGGNSVIHLNCRIICATNQNLEELIEEKKFREDLYYRINVINIKIPPLRERREEIKQLIEDLLDEFNLKYHTNKKLTDEMVTWLSTQRWTGNIRELRNYIERLHITSDTEIIDIEYSNPSSTQTDEISLDSYLEKKEKEFIEQMYAKYPSSVQLSKKIGVSQSTANRKINKYIAKP